MATSVRQPKSTNTKWQSCHAASSNIPSLFGSVTHLRIILDLQVLSTNPMSSPRAPSTPNILGNVGGWSIDLGQLPAPLAAPRARSPGFVARRASAASAPLGSARLPRHARSPCVGFFFLFCCVFGNCRGPASVLLSYLGSGRTRLQVHFDLCSYGDGAAVHPSDSVTKGPQCFCEFLHASAANEHF